MPDSSEKIHHDSLSHNSLNHDSMNHDSVNCKAISGNGNGNGGDDRALAPGSGQAASVCIMKWLF
jgi:hypothetical protein